MAEHKTQGTQLYVLDESVSPPQVLKIANLISVDSLGGQASDIDVTNFDDLVYRRFLSGLIDPGTSNIAMNFDNVASLQFLHDNASEQFKFAIGLSDGVDTPPTVASGGSSLSLPTSRTWFNFTASIHQIQYGFAIDDVVKFNSALRISGAITVTAKA